MLFRFVPVVIAHLHFKHELEVEMLTAMICISRCSRYRPVLFHKLTSIIKHICMYYVYVIILALCSAQ